MAVETIGRYKIESLIGRGGMGVVYRAIDPILNRPVAIKLLAAHLLEDEAAMARFRREAQLVARLKHPHIALVYEMGKHDEMPYIVMEWIEGRTLRQLIEQEGALPLDRTMHLMNQMVSALDYAHELGIVHRDIKPANVIISDDNVATIIDFGLGGMDDAAGTLALTGSLMGTPLYVAPEQIQGRQVDKRTDEYSLAIVLYEMLVGVPPFEQPSTPAVLHQQLYSKPVPITEHDPTLPIQVETVLNRALSKEPDNRYATVSEFARDLTIELPYAINERPQLPPPPQTQPSRFVGTVWLALAGLLLLAGGTFAYQRLQPAVQPATVVVNCNLLDDSSFEAGALAVDMTPLESMERVVPRLGRNNTNAMQLGESGVNGLFSTVLPAVEGQTYTLGGWFKRVGDVENANMGIEFWEGTLSGNSLAQHETIVTGTLNTDYVYFEVTAEAPAGTRSLVYWMYKDWSPGHLLVDDMILFNDGMNCIGVEEE